MWCAVVCCGVLWSGGGVDLKMNKVRASEALLREGTDKSHFHLIVIIYSEIIFCLVNARELL